MTKRKRLRWAAQLVLGLLLVAGWRAASLSRIAQAGTAAQEEDGLSEQAAASAAEKLRQIEDASYPGRSIGVVRLTEQEANSYLHYELSSSFPPGVSRARLKFRPGSILGSSLVDFDKWKEGLRTPPNPLADFLLQGVHTVMVGGTLQGANGTAEFHVETVQLDDVTVPQPLVDFMVEYYLKPRYPGAAVNRPFSLPDPLEGIRMEAGSAVLIGKRE